MPLLSREEVTRNEVVLAHSRYVLFDCEVFSVSAPYKGGRKPEIPPFFQPGFQGGKSRKNYRLQGTT